MFETYLPMKLPFYLGYIYKVNVELKGQGQRLGPHVRVKGAGQRSMSRSNVWDIAVN